MRLTLVLLLALAGCHPQPKKPAPGEVPPLPPASGTAVGYLVDASTELKLRDDQLDKAKKILTERGVDIPGETKKEETRNPDEGTPLPGMEP